MANVQFSGCDFVDSQALGALFFNDKTLLIDLATYTNVTNRPLTATVTDPTGKVTSFVWPPLGTSPNTGNGSGSSNLSGFGLHMVETQVVSPKGSGPVFNLPDGWSIGYSYG